MIKDKKKNLVKHRAQKYIDPSNALFKEVYNGFKNGN